MEVNNNLRKADTAFEECLELAILIGYNRTPVPAVEQIQASWKEMDLLLQRQKETRAQ